MTEDPQALIPALPVRQAGRRRDRRGRGLRGPLMPSVTPAWRTRSDRFDDLVLACMERLESRLPDELSGVEFAVEEIPPSEPAPWEHRAVPLGRSFPGDRLAGLNDRIVLYRRPLLTRATGEEEVEILVRTVLAEQVSHLLEIPLEDVDPDL